MSQVQKCFSNIFAFLTVCAYIRASYQQHVLIGNNITFYSTAHKMPNTITKFWHDNNVDCKIDLKRLLEIYDQLMKMSDMEVDQFNDLLRHHLKRTIIHELHTSLTSILFGKTIKFDLYQKLHNSLNELYKIDTRLAVTIMELSINKAYLFIDHEEFIRKLVRLKLDEVQIIAVEKILDKYIPDKTKTKILPLLTYYITTVYKNRLTCMSCNPYLYAVYERLPNELRILYESIDQTIILVNQAPQTSITGIESDEKPLRLLITFNHEGFVAFGRQYGDHINYLGVKDNRTVFYWRNTVLTPNQLWYVIWPEYLYRWNPSGLILFQNRETQHLLCVNGNNMVQGTPDPKGKYENKFVLLSATENMLNLECSWRLKNFN